MCAAAQATLLQAAGGKEAADNAPKRADEAAIKALLIQEVSKSATVDEFVTTTLDYVTSLCVFLSDRKSFQADEWIAKARLAAGRAGARQAQAGCAVGSGGAEPALPRAGGGAVHGCLRGCAQGGGGGAPAAGSVH